MSEEVSNESSGKFLSSPFYVLRGAIFLWKHKTLWKYAIAPILIGILVLTVSLGLSYYLIYHYLGGWLQNFFGPAWYWQIVYYLVVVIAGLLVLVISFLMFTIIATSIAGPFNDMISEKTEELVTGRVSNAPFSFNQMIKDISRGVWHSLRILGFYVGVLIPSLLLLLIPGIGFGLFGFVIGLLSSYLLAFEYLGYPMDRRRYSFKEKRAFVHSRMKSALGFGFGNFLWASIPIVNILMIPAAAVGGTLLFLNLSRSAADHLEQSRTENS
jgi:CysZ protein